MHDNKTNGGQSETGESPIRPIDEIRGEKIRKLERLRELGVNPYPPKPQFPLIPITEIFTKSEGSEVAIAGRISSIRTHGGITFVDISNQSGKFQAALKKDHFDSHKLEVFSLLDQSDFIEVKGALFATKSGQLTIDVTDFNLLSKAIRPVPDKPDKDKEVRYRKRYLDILANDNTKHIFDTRHKLTSGIRSFLNNRGLTEVETPVLQPLYGGANAQPFVTNIRALDSEAYLRIAPELYLKRLVVAGYEGVYELAKDFRNEGVDQTHFPEFTMLEVYISYIDYHQMMDTMEQMLRHLSVDVLHIPTVKVHEYDIDLQGEWKRIAMTDLIKEQLQIDVSGSSYQQLREYAYANQLEFDPDISRGELIFLVFDKLISKKLINPTWVIDYPVEVSPLAKEHRDKEGYTERFELYIGGVELMDGWSELTDSLDQRKRFEAESYRKLDKNESAQPLDEDFLEAIEYGTPPFAGVGCGLDRLVMFFTNTWSIQETILFPFKKPLIDKPMQSQEIQQEITGLPSRDEAEKLLDEHVYDNYQHLHAKMVAHVLERYAEKNNKNKDLWYITGLLHDLDFTKYPDRHPHNEIDWFKEWGYPEALINAVQAHAHDRTGVEPQSKLAKILLATDEIAGIMYAYALLRPEGFTGMTASSFNKKLKDKAFAPNISRDEVAYGLSLLEFDPAEHFNLMIEVYEHMSELRKENLHPDKASNESIASVSNSAPITIMDKEAYSIADHVRQLLSGMFYAYTFIDGVNIKKTDSRLQTLVGATVADLQRLSYQDIRDTPSIQAYRKIIKTTGIDPNSHLPSPEALLRRVSSGKGIYQINTAVDAYNLTVLEGGIGLGGFDRTQIYGNVTLRFAREGESIRLIGEQEPMALKSGQLVYADDTQVLTVDLNYRDSDITKITEKTTSIVLFADGAPSISKDDVIDALKHAAELITEFCGGNYGEIHLVE